MSADADGERDGSRTTDEDSATADEDSVPTDEDSATAADDSVTADEDSVPTGDDGATADDGPAGAGSDVPADGRDAATGDTDGNVATPDERDDREPPFRVEVHPGRHAVVEFDPDLTFECVDGCTWCCHHGVLLYDRDVRALAERASLADATTRFRGEDFVRKEDRPGGPAGEDGAACYFLDEEGLCSLQADHDWKPTRCSVFPLEVRREDGDLRVDVRASAREHCEGLDVSERRVVDVLDAFLPPALWDLPDPDTHTEL